MRNISWCPCLKVRVNFLPRRNHAAHFTVISAHDLAAIISYIRQPETLQHSATGAVHIRFHTIIYLENKIRAIKLFDSRRVTLQMRIVDTAQCSL